MKTLFKCYVNGLGIYKTRSVDERFWNIQEAFDVTMAHQKVSVQSTAAYNAKLGAALAEYYDINEEKILEEFDRELWRKV